MIFARKTISVLCFFSLCSLAKAYENDADRRKGLEILFLGITGSGKSSTINMLLGQVVTDVRQRNNELMPTKSVIEYTLQNSSGGDEDYPEINEDENRHFVRFIDTPGIGSTTGMFHEQRVMATLQKYLLEKSPLPSVILIFSKFDENRVEGDKSNFVKMLTKYNELIEQIYKGSPPKIIFVFTHYLGVTKKEQRNPKPRLLMFANIIRNHTTFPPPITTTVADNEAEDEELELDDESGSYLLPNREWYPQNLIDKILDNFEGSELNSYKRIFENRKDLNVDKKFAQGIISANQMKQGTTAKAPGTENEGTTESTKDENIPTDNSTAKTSPTKNSLKGNHSEIPKRSPETIITNSFSTSTIKDSVMEVTEDLENEVTEASENEVTEASANEVTEASENEVIEALENEVIEGSENEITENFENGTTENSVNEVLISHNGPAINPRHENGIATERATVKLNECAEKYNVDLSNLESLSTALENKTHLPKIRDEVILFIQKLSLNENEADMLEKCFSIAIPVLEPEDSIVGYGYDILRNFPLTNTPFRIDEYVHSSLGFKIPNWINSSGIQVEEKLTIQNYFSKMEDFLRIRLQNLSLDNSQLGIKVNEYDPKFTVGNNIREIWTDEEFEKVTSLQEYRLFSLGLQDNNLDFNEEFLETLSELPSFDTFDRDSVNEWTSFFETYGTHVVTFGYGGGSLEVHSYIQRTIIEDLMSQDLLFTVPNPSNNFSGNGQISRQDRLKFNGGQYKHNQYLKLVETLEEQTTDTIVNNWHQSLPTNPIILETNLKLMALSEVIASHNPDLSEEMEKATMAHLTGNLKYIKRRTESSTKKPTFGSTSASVVRTTTKIIFASTASPTTITTAPTTTAPTATASTTITTRTTTTTIKPSPIFSTLSPQEVAPSIWTKPQTFSPGGQEQRKTYQEPTGEILKFQLEIKEIVSILNNTCKMTLPSLPLPEAMSNNYLRLSSSVLKNLNGLITVVSSSRIFCRNKYRYKSILDGLKKSILNGNLSEEELPGIYTQIVYSFPSPPNTFECQRLEIVNHTEFLGSHVGYGYNIQYGLPIAKTPFESVDKYVECDNVFKEDHVIYTFKILDSHVERYSFFKEELRNLSPSEPSYPFVEFFGRFPAGVNPYFYDKAYYEWLEEYVTFSVQFSSKDVRLNSEFTRLVHDLIQADSRWARGNCLPKKVSINWKRIFHRFGTHIVEYSNVGGALKITPSSHEWNQYFRNLNQFNEKEKSRVLGGINKEGLQFHSLGGDTFELFKNKLNPDSLSAWRNSLLENPTSLQSGLKLTPLIKYIKMLRPELGETADAVMRILYSGGIMTLCNCPNCQEFPNSCYTERNGYNKSFLGLCYLPYHFKCSIRHAGCNLKMCPF